MLSLSATSKFISIFGYRLQNRATSAIWASDNWSNRVRSSSSNSIMSNTVSMLFSLQRLMMSALKWGNCFKYDSLLHMACVTICASSIAATAGDSQPFELNTSTQAWIKRMALLRIDSVSPWSSGPSCNRDKWAWSSKLVLMCGSLNLELKRSIGERMVYWTHLGVSLTLVKLHSGQSTC